MRIPNSSGREPNIRRGTSAPSWAYAFFVWQLAVDAYLTLNAHEIFGSHLENLSSWAWGWALALPLALGTGLGWFHPLWFFKPKEAESGLFDPSRRVRRWVVALQALWIGTLPVLTMVLRDRVAEGGLGGGDTYRLFLVWCAVSTVVTGVLRAVVRTPSTVKVPAMLPCPFCGKRWWTRNERCLRCGRDRPPFWYLPAEQRPVDAGDWLTGPGGSPRARKER